MDIFESDEEGKWTRIAGQWRWEPVKGEARKIRIYWYSGPEVVEVSKDLKTIHGSKPNWKRFISPIP
jgi:hypothetical protein